MIKLSRRSIAKYAADQLQSGMKTPLLSKELAALLLNSKKQSEVNLLVLDIMRELEDRGVVAQVKITSAHGLSASLTDQITKFVKQSTKVSDVGLELQTDPDFIGGVRIETANHSWDNTVIKKIDDLRKVF